MAEASNLELLDTTRGLWLLVALSRLCAEYGSFYGVRGSSVLVCVTKRTSANDDHQLGPLLRYGFSSLKGLSQHVFTFLRCTGHSRPFG
jgi:hypothetical protein